MILRSATSITYDASGVLFPENAAPVARQNGLSEADLRHLAPKLKAARDEVTGDLELLARVKKSGDKLPPEKDPLDARFIDHPECLLREYQEKKSESEVARIIAAADRLAGEVDRVVVLGIGGSYMGARAVFEGLCHPYHNELSRAERKGRPRIYFEGNNVDTDSVSGLLDVLPKSGNKVEDRWGIIVISKSGSTLETAVGFRVYVDALREVCGGDKQVAARRMMAVTSRNSRLWKLSKGLGLGDENLFPYPDDIGGRFSVLTAVGLLPAAVLGVDVVKLLEGAQRMTQAFQTEDLSTNPVLGYVGVSRLMEVRRGATIRVLSTWGKRLEALGLWYDQLLAESLGKDGQGATPLTVVNTRDLHSRGQQHQEGRRDKLITNLVVDQSATTPVKLPQWPAEQNQDELNDLAAREMTIADVLDAAIKGTNQAYLEDFRPTAMLRIPKLDAQALGELFQLLMLATALEGRLIGINPYGQPGVEAYKKHMQAFLKGKG
jgi:glucose-6-phosphate isomerase